VARGYFDEAFVETVHARIQVLLREQGAWIDRFYYCPHHPTEGTGVYRTSCPCRKPEAGLLFRASQEMDIDLARSYMVGDMSKDIEAAGKAGAKGILVQMGEIGALSPFSPSLERRKTFDSSVRPDYIARDILDAVTWIMKDREK
jgi:histidinol-phosphate phosphatase family protein